MGASDLARWQRAGTMTQCDGPLSNVSDLIAESISTISGPGRLTRAGSPVLGVSAHYAPGALGWGGLLEGVARGGVAGWPWQAASRAVCAGFG